MLLGFGCTVPAAMGAPPWRTRRTPPHDHHAGSLYVLLRLVTGVRPAHRRLLPPIRRLVVFSSICWDCSPSARASSLKLVFQGDRLWELPLTACPLKDIASTCVGEKVGLPVKAGTLILGHECLVLSLQSLALRAGPLAWCPSEESPPILGLLGGLLVPCSPPLGFGTWQAAVALLT